MSLAEVQTEQRVDIAAEMRAVGRAARAAARRLARATTSEKNKALAAMAAAIRAAEETILDENVLDLGDARAANLTGSFLDRLTLTPERIEAMARGVEEIAALPDPIGAVLAAWDRPNGSISSGCGPRSASSASSTRAGRT